MVKIIISVYNNIMAAAVMFVVMAIATRCLTHPALRVIALQNNKTSINKSIKSIINFCNVQ